MHFAIIGQGLAGSSLAIEADKKGHDITCFDLSNENSASRVAIGIINPLVLKNRTLFDKSEMLLSNCLSYYNRIEKTFQKSLLSKNHIREVLFNPSEVSNWNSLSKESSLEKYIGSIETTHKSLSALGLGCVKNSLRLDVKNYLHVIRTWLSEKHRLQEEDVKNVFVSKNEVIVNGQKFDGLLLAEGLIAKWTQKIFRPLQFSPTKGEGLVIETTNTHIDFPVHRNTFLLKENENRYTVGATFNRKDLQTGPSQAGKDSLIQELSYWFQDDFKIVHHWSGLRPTMKDRRICFGWHKEFPNVGFLNGLGSRGAMTSPYYSSLLLAQHKS
jgi:glycine/D-amino acid oxidase-like deaminating enzyme